MVWWSMMDGSERCMRCGATMYGFSRKVAESDGLCYCTKCAELLDKRYLIENTCSVCARHLGKSEAKFVMPSSIYSASLLPVTRRLICVSCYRRFAIKSRARPIRSIRQLRQGFRRVLLARSISPSAAPVRGASQSAARISN